MSTKHVKGEVPVKLRVLASINLPIILIFVLLWFLLFRIIHSPYCPHGFMTWQVLFLVRLCLFLKRKARDFLSSFRSAGLFTINTAWKHGLKSALPAPWEHFCGAGCLQEQRQNPCPAACRIRTLVSKCYSAADNLWQAKEVLFILSWMFKKQ